MKFTDAIKFKKKITRKGDADGETCINAGFPRLIGTPRFEDLMADDWELVESIEQELCESCEAAKEMRELPAGKGWENHIRDIMAAHLEGSHCTCGEGDNR